MHFLNKVKILKLASTPTFSRKKIRSSDEIQGAIHMMKSQAKKVQTYTSNKWKHEGNQIQFNFNVENLHELVQSISALEKYNGKWITHVT